MSTASRWRFHPWGRNARAICERLEALIVEIRVAEVRAQEIGSLTTSMQTAARMAYIKGRA